MHPFFRRTYMARLLNCRPQLDVAALDCRTGTETRSLRKRVASSWCPAEFCLRTITINQNCRLRVLPVGPRGCSQGDVGTRRRLPGAVAVTALATLPPRPAQCVSRFLYQISLAPSMICRAGLARSATALIRPNEAVPNDKPGSANTGRFKALKASPRS